MPDPDGQDRRRSSVRLKYANKWRVVFFVLVSVLELIVIATAEFGRKFLSHGAVYAIGVGCAVGLVLIVWVCLDRMYWHDPAKCPYCRYPLGDGSVCSECGASRERSRAVGRNTRPR